MNIAVWCGCKEDFKMVKIFQIGQTVLNLEMFVFLIELNTM